MYAWKTPLSSVLGRATLFVVIATEFSIAQETKSTEASSPQDELTKIYKKSYALVIGVSQYQSLPLLPNAVPDAEEVAEALNLHGFEITLKNNPTKSQLKSALDEFFFSYGLSDSNRLLIYFAGHGYTRINFEKINVGYIALADAANPEQDERGFNFGALDMGEILQYAKNCKARHVFFVFDCCFSGAILIRTRAVLPSAVEYVASYPVRQFLTAGDENETVPDVSIFKKQFLAAIHGHADRNRDGYITGTEIGEYVYYEVAKRTNRQHPQYGKLNWMDFDKGEFVFKARETIVGQDTTVLQPPPLVATKAPQAFGWLEIDSPYAANFYVDGKPAATNTRYLRTIVLPNFYHIRIAGKKGYEYKEKVVIRDGETAKVSPLKIRSGF